MSKVDDFLAQLRSFLTLEEELLMDEERQCFLLFDENMLVRIKEHQGENLITLSAKLGNVKETKMQQVYPQLLENNLQINNQSIYSFAIEELSNNVLLMRSVPLSCTYELFEKSLEEFVNATEYWLKELPNITNFGFKPSAEYVDAFASQV